jgi:hypothetical protein
MRTMAFARLGCVLSLGLAGCVAPSILGDAETGTDGDDDDGDDDGQTSMPTGDDTGDDGGTDSGPPPTDGPPKVDFLFVIDNSGSMGDTQAALAGGLEAFVASLDAAGDLSYRIGVTTTDNGNPYCDTGPEAGKLQLSSCRERQGQFIFTGTPMADVTAIACTDICSLDEIPIVPTTTELDPEPRARPWIEGGAEGANLDGASVADALRCTMPQGIAGCGFEAPLEAAYKALLRSSNADEQQYGFMRSDAHLAIVFITDEVDCSYNNDFVQIFYDSDQGGNQVFWTDPESPHPSSGLCWNAGVECTGGPGTYDECHAANKDVDGNVGVSDDDAVLLPISRYRDFLLELQDAKREISDASVFMFGIVGVPEGYPATPIPYADGEGQQQLDFGIGPGCTNEDGRIATPPTRIVELAESFGNPVATNLFSICGDVPGALDPIVQAILAHID